MAERCSFIGGDVFQNVPQEFDVVLIKHFFPTYFLGCATGQGGPQKLSTYQEWLEECGFTVTKAISQDLADVPADSLVAHGILCATKTASL